MSKVPDEDNDELSILATLDARVGAFFTIEIIFLATKRNNKTQTNNDDDER